MSPRPFIPDGPVPSEVEGRTPSRDEGSRLKPLDFGFALMSGLSVRPPHRVAPDEWLLEIDEELDRRRRAYPMFVAEKRMKEEDAARHIAVLLAIRSDLAGHWNRSESWDVKVRELRRELALRRNAYPSQIERRRLRPAEAVMRMERMEAVHWRYWIALDFFDCGERAGAPFAERLPLIRAASEAVRAWEIAAHAAGNPAAREYVDPAP